MPLYEYECGSCGRRSEVLQRFDDPALTTCDECGGPIRRLISAPAFQFKGSGWYVTDYAAKSSGKSAGVGKGSEAAKESAADSGDRGGEAKTPAPTPAKPSASTTKD